MPTEMAGRSRELEFISGFVHATERSLVALIIEGEAGIGKASLWLAGVAQAETSGCRFLQARPAENEQRLSYWVLADLIGDPFDESRTALPAP